MWRIAKCPERLTVTKKFWDAATLVSFEVFNLRVSLTLRSMWTKNFIAVWCIGCKIQCCLTQSGINVRLVVAQSFWQ